MGITGYTRLKKYDLVMRLLHASAESQGYIFGGGTLEIVQDGIGFLRSEYLLPATKMFMSARARSPFRFAHWRLCRGTGASAKRDREISRPAQSGSRQQSGPRRGQATPQLREAYSDLPQPAACVEARSNIISARMIDLLAPIGRGQRPDRQPAQVPENHHPQARRQRHHRQLQRHPPDGGAHRRTP